jgi:hypothetical protein
MAAVAERPGQAVQQSNLLSLPPEILILIFEQCGTFDLLALARTSRRLNVVAIHVYLSRFRIFQGLETREIEFEGKNMRILPGLQASLTLPPLDRVSVKFACDARFAQDLRQFLAYMSRSGSIRQVTLYFGAIDCIDWLDGFSVVGPDLAVIDPYRSKLTELLSILITSKCEILDVRCGHYVSCGRDRPVEKDMMTIGQKCRAFLRLSILTVFGFFLALSMTRAGKKPTPQTPVIEQDRTLRTFRLHSDLFFTIPFYSWMMEMLKTTPITSISLQASPVSEEEWKSFLCSLTIPTLTHAAFISPHIPLSELLIFAARHPDLTSVDLPPHSYRSRTAVKRLPKKWKLSLPTLSFLGGHPTNLRHFLDRSSPFPALQHFSLSLPPFKRDIKAVNSVVASTIKDYEPRVLTLEFIFPSAFDDLRIYSNSEASNSSCLSPTVEDIRFRSDGSFAFSERTLPLLPPWLATFPALRKVSFITACLYCEAEQWQDFVRATRKACPLLEDVIVYDDGEGP